MFHIFLGCFSWVFFYITLKSHFRQRTDLGDWDFYVDDEGEGCVTYTYRRDPAILRDSSGEEEEDEEEDEEEQQPQQKEEGETPLPTAEDGRHSDGSETLDEYIVTSDDDEVAEAGKEEEEKEEKEEEEPTVECDSEEEAELEDVDHVEPARSPSTIDTTLIDTWTSFPARGFDAFMEELLTGLTDEEKVQAESAINRVHNIQQKDWLDTLKTVVVSKSFDLTGCSGRVRARLMAPSIWLDYTSGEKELSEYLFAISIYRWVTGR
jgi:hypothetical protein